MENETCEIISTYTRAQGIADGVLVDVSEVAREAGIKFPVAMTSSVWAEYVTVPNGVKCQDEDGRLWDILYMMANAAKRTPGSRLKFQVYVRNHNRQRLTNRDLITLQAVVGPGDTAAPVITIMRLNED
jgi:hypothetical protein